MRWARNEIDRLTLILEQISSDLAPVDGKQIVVLCSATGELVFWLGEMMEQGKVTGVELDDEAVDIARQAGHEMGLDGVVEFMAGKEDQIPLAEASQDALVSELIVYPSATRSQVGTAEMARVLKPGGRMILTDVMVSKPLPPAVREELELIGLDYLCEGSPADFQRRMRVAGLKRVEMRDMTPTLRAVWEARQENDLIASHERGYSILLEDVQYGLGRAIFYVYGRGEKPDSEG